MAWMMKGEKLLPHNVHSPTRFKAPLVLSVAGPFHEQRGPFLESRRPALEKKNTPNKSTRREKKYTKQKYVKRKITH